MPHRQRPLLVLLVAAACSRSEAVQPAPPPIPVQIGRVDSVQLRDSTEYLSTLKSRRSVSVQPQVEGWITAIHVVSGEHVEAGTLLMDIDFRRQLAAVRAQEATRAARIANEVYWKQQHARLERLYAGGGASKQEVDQASSSLLAAEGDVKAQDQQVHSESVLLRYYKVIAAEQGTVGDVPVRVGDFVNTATVLTTLDHNEMLEAYVNVPVDHAPQIHLNLPVEILDEDGELLASSRVSFVSPQVSPDQTILIKSWLDNAERKFRNNQLVRVRVVWRAQKGPVIPVLAVQTRNGQTFAWAVKDDGRNGLTAEQRTIEVGPIQGQVYPILKGLSPGERIVVSGIQKLRPGARVTAAAQAGS